MLLVKSGKCQGSGDGVPGRGAWCNRRSTLKPDEPNLRSQQVHP